MRTDIGPPQEAGDLSVAKALKGKNLLWIGSTGFVGKVVLALLLDQYRDSIGRVYCLVRKPRDGRSAAERFADEVVGSEPLLEVKKKLDDAEFDAWVDDHLVAVGGDITLPNLGFTDDEVARITGECDVVVNCSGLVDFNPPLDDAVSINVVGVQAVVDFAHKCRGKHLVHVSTTYVTGNRDGFVKEDPDLVDWYPLKESGELDGSTFDFREELAACIRDIERTSEESHTTHLASRFAEAARERLRKDDRDPDEPDSLAEETADQRKRWIEGQLIDRGMERAQHWGWPNTYTFTKSLGEQVVASSGLDRWAIARPAVVESSVRFPFPGWNEGINTSAPLIFLAIKGHTKYPTRDGVTLDVVPVDLVATAMIAIVAALLEDRHAPVYQLGTSDLNPIGLPRMVRLVGLYKRDYYRRRPRGNPLLNRAAAWVECGPVPLAEFRRTSAPAIKEASRWVSEKLSGDGKDRLAGPGGLRQSLGRGIMGLSKTSSKTQDIFELFLPFIHDNFFTFDGSVTRNLMWEQLDQASRESLPWDPQAIEWRHYWLDIHCMGLERWVFPKIKEKIKPRPRKVHRYDHLVHLFRSTTKVHKERTALRYLRVDGSTDRWTYGELSDRATAVAGRVAEAGVKPGQSVALCSDNRPEWAACYFGILRAGAVVVPIDRDSTADELARICDRAEAALLITSSAVGERLNGELKTARADIEAICALEDAPDAPDVAPPQPEDTASLIFTSGTTGRPKAVMLTHGNFTFLLQSLAKVFKLEEKDGLLSALPLHHTFEFACGFLTPLARGAQIIYLEELDADMLSRAFAGGRVTCMVGVPALWELLHKKVKNQVRAKGKTAERVFDGLMAANKALRDNAGVNLGRVLFAPVHDGFGGKIRFLVSGGASLPPELQKAFHSLGMDLMEGYGLTEASPVLTVTRPGKRPKAGSVGRALPGVELKIVDEDAEGVGEIWARGENVMKGYLGDPEATAETVDADGWLHTGDYGRIDHRDRLFIQGRKKEIIVEASGKNVYPDELEELYKEHDDIEEISVVGVSDGRGHERIAALVVAQDDEDKGRAEARADIEQHFKDVSAGLPGWKRVKVLRFFEGELPRTATKKIKRREVVGILENMLEAERAAEQAGQEERSPSGIRASDAWFRAAIASLCDRSADAVRMEHKLEADLGFDSLLLTELLSTLENATGKLIEPDALAACETVADVRDLVGRSNLPTGKAKKERDRDDDDDRRVIFPEPVQEAGKGLLRSAQRFLYGDWMSTKVRGRGNIPRNRTLLIVSNHQSHLDMGLVKHALGDMGGKVVAMAAADYFFRPGPRRTWFENFTNLEPMERSGSLKESLMKGVRLLERGKHVLIFPEGTRSRSGKMAPFKRGVGYLALQADIDVLPLYLAGTHDVLPVGSAVPTGRKLEARIGPALTAATLREHTESLSRHKAYDVATALIEDAVVALRDRRATDPTAAIRKVLGDEAPAPEAGEAAAAPVLSSLDVLFEDLQKRFRANAVAEPVSFYFSLGAEDRDKYTLVIEPERCAVTHGKTIDKADCVLKTDEGTFTRIVKEHYVPSFAEFMSGKVKTNSPDLLRTFQKAFGL